MKILRRIICYFFFLLLCFDAPAQDTDSILNRLIGYVRSVNDFSKYIPQENIYLHFDNTSYYQGDNIWFKSYVVASGLNPPNQLSKTLYVELLNPGGEVIDKRVLKLENGRCHGDFILNRIPFYSGFYEIRAYTKYMLNFGEDIVFSRLFPVFDKPKVEGDYTQRKMVRPGSYNYPMKREKPHKDKKVNLRFFPEGGNLVQGITSQMAFQATDAYGKPLQANGAIIDGSNAELFRFSALHDGRGVFAYTPGEKRKAELEYNGKKYQFDIPEALPRGYVLSVDHLSYTDSIEVTLQKNENTPCDTLGLLVTSQGKPYNFCLVRVAGNEKIHIKFDKTILPSGVSRMVLFNSRGKILCDRLFFIHRNEFLTIKTKAGKESYKPYELVDMEFSVTDREGNPVQTEFSLSVKDRKDQVDYYRNIQTDFLLMSEIKGYVHKPSYYFETDDSDHRQALDHLLMVQGWRRYSWEQMAGIESFELKYQPEQGIETRGQVVSFVKGKPQPGVQVSSFLLQKGQNEGNGTFAGAYVTDSMGRFSFSSDLYGKWNMILAVTEKGKKKDHRILLDRLFSPDPRNYLRAEMQIDVANPEENEIIVDTLSSFTKEEDIETLLSAYTDSLNREGVKEKIHRLDEVTVTAKIKYREKQILYSKEKSIAYYDVHSELDNIRDNDKYIGDDIHEFLKTIDKNFMRKYTAEGDFIIYHGKEPLFVVNYERTRRDELDSNKYKTIRLEAIKSIYVCEKLNVMCEYADMNMTPMEVDGKYGCAVFIETYPEGQIPVDPGKGVRKTFLNGYSQVREFYTPDYSILPPDPDYRRTLYWNPSVTSDEKGKAEVNFYNNSRCNKLSITVETITAEGVIGVYQN